MSTDQIATNDFMRDVLVFIDRNGKIEGKHSSGVNCGLSMSYKAKSMRANFDVYSHAMGNGSCSVTVYYNNRKVYKASGCFMGTPFGVEEEIYKPGKWEELMKVKRVAKAA